MTTQARAFPIFVLAASAVVLGVALASQYWGGLAPCELCLKERWPWIAAIAISLVATTTSRRPTSPRIALMLAAVFVIGGALAFYHVGVEQHWFAGPSACTAAAGTPTTLEALKAQLLHQQPVRCDEPAWALFGISLAGWNLLASLAMAGICLVMFFLLRGTGRSGIGRRIA
jgi:disulfide bond formation protein DsbB